MNQDTQQNPLIITLAQFLKWKGLVQTGGEAKNRIQGGEVLVDGIVETRRGRKLTTGKRVTINGATHEVKL